MKNKKNIEDIYPLTDNQTTFLLNHLTHSANDSGQVRVQCQFTGRLDKPKFISAWAAVMQRHSTLRASVHWENLPQPLQVVHRQVDPLSVLQMMDVRQSLTISCSNSIRFQLTG